jgi:L-rhamnose-H+ transport protein
VNANPALGVLLHAIGGLAAGSFYVPYQKVRLWAWETYWLAGGVFSWILAPWILAMLIVPQTPQILASANPRVLFWTYFWGAMWGIGGLTFGLTMRYLGIALGMAVALGYCAAFGTLMPPLVSGDLVKNAHLTSEQVVLLGVVICLTGIAISGWAGVSKEHELTEEQKKAGVSEFNFWKGLMVATFSGIMSASMAYGMTAGDPIAKFGVKHYGVPDLWQNLPVLCVVLLGGFTTNFIWCAYLNIRNGTGREYFTSVKQADGSEVEQASAATVVRSPDKAGKQSLLVRVPMLSNYIFCAIAGVTWYLQFFFYSMGTTKMGKYNFSSWTLHMSFIIIFSTLWGIALREWRGTSRRTHILVGIGLFVLVGSTFIVGYGNYLALPGH